MNRAQRRAAKFGSRQLSEPASVDCEASAATSREANRRIAYASVGLGIDDAVNVVADRTWPGVQSDDQLVGELRPLADHRRACSRPRTWPATIPADGCSGWEREPGSDGEIHAERA